MSLEVREMKASPRISAVHRVTPTVESSRSEVPDRSPTDDVSGSKSPSTESRWTQLTAMMAKAVRRQCPAWLSHAAQDIAQVALSKVMAAERRNEGDRPLTAFYLHRAAHSALVDEIRRRKRRPEVALEVATDEGDEVRIVEPTALDDPERQASFRELGGAVREYLLHAKRERRLAVTLYLQGHSVAETARLLRWDPKRTENLVYRGIADLRAWLLKKGYRP